MTKLSEQGKRLLDQLGEHVLAVMEAAPECAPGGMGLGNNDIEALAGLALNLESQDHFVTWSALQILIRKKIVEEVRKKRGRILVHFRLC